MQKIDPNLITQYLPPRPHECNKGDFGKVLIIGGDFGFSGATLLAGNAALHVGAGLVSIATRPEHARVLNVSSPELMCHGVTSANDIKELFSQATVVVIGPGLGKSNWAQELLSFVLAENNKPLLLDADALNLLSQMNPIRKSKWVLTPHPGEAARLLKTTSKEVQKDRLSALQKLHETFDGVIVLKGAGTLVISDDYSAEICEAGNPGMATAGMGDVLSGVIAGLIAQKIPFPDAVKLGVLIHAMAGDLAAINGERGMVASDLFPYLRQLVNPTKTR